jgi:hypothetical protein
VKFEPPCNLYNSICEQPPSCWLSPQLGKIRKPLRPRKVEFLDQYRDTRFSVMFSQFISDVPVLAGATGRDPGAVLLGAATHLWCHHIRRISSGSAGAPPRVLSSSEITPPHQWCATATKHSDSTNSLSRRNFRFWAPTL